MTASTQAAIETLRLIAAKEPIGVDISDYSDEWCDGFRAGQVNAIDEILVPRLSAVEAEVREAHNTVSLLETDLRRKDDALKEAAEKLDLIVRIVRNSRRAPNVWETISDCATWGRDDARAALAPVSPSEPVPQQAEEERCSCGGIDAVPHATDHAPDCTVWGALAEQQTEDVPS